MRPWTLAFAGTLLLTVGITTTVAAPASGQARHGSRTATATTIVPAAPSGLSLSSATLDVDTTFVPGPGTGLPPFDALTIRWSNSARLYHFAATENIETNPKKILTPDGFGLILERISAPTTVDRALVAAPEFGYYGRYKVKLYRVGEEYVNLYRGRQQDSRDLNEPPTNISGALGIFAAFAADSAFFVVR